RVGVRADLEAIRVGVQRGWLFEQRAMMGVVVLIVHGCCKEGFPIAQGEEEFLVVPARVVAVLDVDEAELARVPALVQVIHCHGVRVIPPASGWTGCEFEVTTSIPTRLPARRRRRGPGAAPLYPTVERIWERSSSTVTGAMRSK